MISASYAVPQGAYEAWNTGACRSRQARRPGEDKDAEKEAADWLKARETALNMRYEKELMNPKEGLSLGSISSLVMPTDLRKVLGENMNFLPRHYKPWPMRRIQREFH